MDDIVENLVAIAAGYEEEGADPSAIQCFRDAAAEIERLREVLEPFGREHVQPWHETPDDAAMVPVLDDEHRDGGLVAGHFRRARAALRTGEGK